jgi:hypothetical protein
MSRDHKSKLTSKELAAYHQAPKGRGTKILPNSTLDRYEWTSFPVV